MEKFAALVWNEDNSFVSKLNGTNISSYGETVEEAIANLKEATELYFEDMPENEKRKILESIPTIPSYVKEARTFPFSFNAEDTT